jgi:hypothetical protein
MVLINEVEISADPLDYCAFDAVHCCTGLWFFLLSPGPVEECMVSMEMRNTMTVDSFSAVILIRAFEYRSWKAGWFGLITPAGRREISNVRSA